MHPCHDVRGSIPYTFEMRKCRARSGGKVTTLRQRGAKALLQDELLLLAKTPIRRSVWSCWTLDLLLARKPFTQGSTLHVRACVWQPHNRQFQAINTAAPTTAITLARPGQFIGGLLEGDTTSFW